MAKVTDALRLSTSTLASMSHTLMSQSISTTTQSISTTSHTEFHSKIPVTSPDHRELFRNVSLKDETVYAAVIVMGLIVPSIFVFVIVMICLKRRKEQNNRRQQMLLTNQQDVAMYDIPYRMRSHLAAGNFA